MVKRTVLGPVALGHQALKGRMLMDKLLQSLVYKLNYQGLSYIVYLAMQGNDKKIVPYLTDSHSKHFYDAIYGYACIDNQPRVKQLIAKAKDRYQAIKRAVNGYARFDHHSSLETLPSLSVYKSQLIQAYAIAGKQDLVASMVNQNMTLFHQAIIGYSMGGHRDFLLDLLKGTNLYSNAIYYAAKSGNKALVTDLHLVCGIEKNEIIEPLLSNKESIQKFYFLNQAISGYCSGGHLKAVAELLARGGDKLSALDALKEQSMPNINLYSCLLAMIDNDDLFANIKNLIDEEFELASAEMPNINTWQEISLLRSKHLKYPNLSLLGLLIFNHNQSVNIDALYGQDSFSLLEKYLNA